MATPKVFVAAIGALLALGCSGVGAATTQETYTYPGCANVDDACPRLGTVACAQESLRHQHDACLTASDCVPAALEGKCTGLGVCGPAYFVAHGQAGAFLAEAHVEISKYCPTTGAHCQTSPSCAYGPSSTHPTCIEGHCGWTLDGGS